jgi:hypothetical protein
VTIRRLYGAPDEPRSARLDEQSVDIVLGQMTELEINALLDAHDTLVRACVESRLAFGEFVAGYGDFPAVLDEGAGRAVLRLFARRIAFHRRIAGVISGLRGEGDSAGMETEVGRFMPMVGLTRLRELVARYPDLGCVGAEPLLSLER